MTTPPSQTKDISEQEDDIFHQLGSQDFQNEPQNYKSLVKSKKEEQLRVSVDSPFSRANDDANSIRKLREERALMLRDETNEIRRQLDSVKDRLNQLKETDHSSSNSSNKGEENEKVSEAKQRQIAKTGRNLATKTETSKKLEAHLDPRLRPLTGRADCPNCTCDRRNSVCDKCIDSNLANVEDYRRHSNSSMVPMGGRNSIDRTPSKSDYDERPIRPTISNKLASVETVVDHVTVPGKIYTISKSLNEKRSKLAQAIDELELMIDKVKEKELRLEQERKVVKLYKDQWKFGPNIGGPKANSRERLGLSNNNQRNYESRLDSQLNRDTKSLMGFNHIESGMKLRQYNTHGSTKKPFRIVRKGATTQTKSNVARSKSLESLKVHNPIPNQDSIRVTSKGFQADKSSSEMNLTKDKDNLDYDQEEIEEILEENVDTREEVGEVGEKSSPVGPKELSKSTEELRPSESEKVEKVKKMTWIPVFGETEVKHVKLTQPKRKVVQILSPEHSLTNRKFSSSQGNINRYTNTRNNNFKRQDCNLTNQRPIDRSTRYNILTGSGGSDARSRNSSGLREARETLKVASNLLEEEQRDSRVKNQLTITRRQPMQSNLMNRQQSSTNPTSRQAHMTSVKTASATRLNLQHNDHQSEIIKLEGKFNELQQMLEKLMQAKSERSVLSPITVTTCSPSSCCHCNGSPRPLSISPNRVRNDQHMVMGTTSNRSPLIHNLRDKLNKTKLRLARTLEEEKQKHQLLKEKVDSSLRKQSDLEQENELLKDSLSKCIDTCLKDISNTFESLNQTLESDSTTINKTGLLSTPVNNSDGFVLTNAAQLLSDNRHLKQMKTHIEAIERQRKGIFEELSKEKRKSNQLELQLKQSQTELNKLVEIKRKIESQSTNIAFNEQVLDSSAKSVNDTNEPIPSTSKQQDTDGKSSPIDHKSDELDDSSYNSIDVYRRYIESMSPDIEAIRRERKLILNEFDNIKKMMMTSDMNKSC